MTSVKPQYLVRIWGRDEVEVIALRTPDTTEVNGISCYWFPTSNDRQQFLASIPENCWVMRDIRDPGFDGEEDINTRARTVALVSLRLPDGREGSFEMDFGYGYPVHSVHFMWEEGNYSCDCNKRLYLARECGIDPENEDLDIVMCGDTIELVSLAVRQVED